MVETLHFQSFKLHCKILTLYVKIINDNNQEFTIIVILKLIE